MPIRNAVVQTMEASWGDVAMMLSLSIRGWVPYLRGSHRRAAGAAGQSVGSDGQYRTEFGSGLGGVSTTATLDGDEYVINGEKILSMPVPAPPTSGSGARKRTKTRCA